MCQQLILEKKIEDCSLFRGTSPGVYDFDRLIDFDADGYDSEGKIIFKFRKNAIPSSINDNYPKLAAICRRNVSLRSDAVGHQIYEVSRTIGYDLNTRNNNYISETGFTRDHHREYKSIINVIEMVNDIYRKEFPDYYYAQERLDVDPHFLIGRSIFSQSIFNKSFRTFLHRDRSNAEGTISNMICLGDESFSGGYLVLPEYRVAINMRPKDYLGFYGREIWHGNTEIKGPGIRLTIVCYLKKEIIGKKYEEELLKAGKLRS